MTLAQQIEAELDAIVRDSGSAIWIARIDREIISERIAKALDRSEATPGPSDAFIDTVSLETAREIDALVPLQSAQKTARIQIIIRKAILRFGQVADARAESQSGSAAQGEMQHGCPYIDGDECLLEKQSFGPCLCANPVAQPIGKPKSLISAGQVDNTLSKLDQGAAHQGSPQGFGFSWQRLCSEAAQIIRLMRSRPPSPTAPAQTSRLCSCKASDRNGRHMAWCPAAPALPSTNCGSGE